MVDTPLAYWRLGDASGTTMTDSSGNGRNGTYVGPPALGAASLLASDADTAVTFDGTNDYAHLPHATWMNAATWTYGVVANLATLANEPTIGSQWGSTDSTQRWLAAVMADGRVRLAMRDSSTMFRDLYSPAGTVTAGTTYYIEFSFDGSPKIVVNGSLVATGAAFTGAAQAGPLWIGGSASGAATSRVNGTLDEAVFYGTAQTPARALARYNAGTTIPPPPSERKKPLGAMVLPGPVVIESGV